MRNLTTVITISLIFILSGCGGGEPTFDASSEESVEASLAAMFPETDFPLSMEDGDLPLGIQIFMCRVLQFAFQSSGSAEEGQLEVWSEFDGMTVADIEAYGVELDLAGGCMG
jgi:hypothetical protein